MVCIAAVLSCSASFTKVKTAVLAFRPPSLQSQKCLFPAFGTIESREGICGLRISRTTARPIYMQATQDKVIPPVRQETLGERYLRESNRCRPATTRCVRIYDDEDVSDDPEERGTAAREEDCLVSFKVGSKILIATPEVALSAQCDALIDDMQRESGGTQAAVTCYGDQRKCKAIIQRYPKCDCLPYVPSMASKLLCTVAFCEDQRPTLPSRLLEASFQSSPDFARLFLRVASSSLAQNLFPRLPWPLQRWVVSRIGRVEALLSMRRFETAIATSDNPLLRRRVLPILDADECAQIVADAEQVSGFPRPVLRAGRV